MPFDISERAEKFSKIVDKASHLNILFTQPDPDAIASAIGLGYLLDKKFGKISRIFYSGRVSHPQNKYIITKYNLARMMKPIEKMAESITGDSLALVDSCSPQDSRLPADRKISPVIIIDHHRDEDLYEETENTFIWVEDVGAASTLIVELFSQFEIILNEEDKWLAILLALGIYTDTKGLIAASNRDRTAYGAMADLVPASEIAELIKYPIPENFFKHLQYSLETITHEGPRIVAGIGMIEPEEGDYISSIADFLTRMEGITLILAWGIVGDNVRISTRGHDASFPLDEFMKKKFGPGAGAKVTPDGHSEGGAILEFKLSPWLSPTTKDDICRVVHKRLCEIVFDN